jgi:hypothetical protein
MHTELAARIDETVNDQQPQHLLPTHGFTALRQTLLPELIQAQLLPQFAGQPAVAEHTWPSQFQTTQPDLRAIHCIGRKLSISREQTHRGETLLYLIEYLQRFPPRGLLLIVDLTQIQHRALRRLATGQPPVFDDAEVAMILPIFPAVGATQKHVSGAECQRFRG